jgi:hypothetical protein
VVITEEFVAIEHGGGEDQVFAKEIPTEPSNFHGRKVAIKQAEALVDGADAAGGWRGHGGSPSMRAAGDWHSARRD